ncbi:Secologanin synthase [Panicum miliaceum]|uniref:Secologanin synthase n=1 Tax=Panicum miliaceum TaxID=4540 RepID=A0A3L6P956_PANMI|nr:Secologanin synthase [Panicum miliaceum]
MRGGHLAGDAEPYRGRASCRARVRQQLPRGQDDLSAPIQEEQIELTILAMDKLHIPGYLFLPTRTNRRMEQIAAEIEVALRRIVPKREHGLRNGEVTSDDLLGLLLESNMELQGRRR